MSSKRPKKQSGSARKATKSENHYFSVDSNKGELSISRVELKTRIKKEKINLYSNPKSLLPIYAYQSHTLKKCLLQNPKEMRRFFHAHGKCQSNGWKEELYAKPFLTYFREWRKDLRERLTNIVLVITESERTIDDEDTEKMLHEIEYIVEELKEANKEIILHSSKEDKSVKETKSFQQNFEHTEEYIKHLINLIRFLSEFEKEIKKLLQEIITNGDEATFEADNKEIQKRIKDLHAKYYKLIFSSFSFCTSHPESSFMNKAEYRIKKRFDSILESVVETSIKALKLKAERNLLKTKLKSISINSNSNPSVEELEEISTAIEPYKYLSNRLPSSLPPNQSNMTSNLTATTVNTYQIDYHVAVHPLIAELEVEITELITEFLNKFELESAFIIENEFERLREYRAESCFEEKEIFKTNKKKLLLIANIFNRNPFLGYYSILSTFIKENSKEYQDISEVIKNIYDKAQSKKPDENFIYTPKIIKYILQLVLKFEEKQDNICTAMKLKFSIQSEKKPIRIRESEELESFLKVWDFSMNKSVKLQEALAVPKYENQKLSQTITNEKMQKLVEMNNDQIYKIITQILPNCTTNSNQLFKFMENKLINKFISCKTNSDTHVDSLDPCLPIVELFYSKIYNSKHNNREITSESVINMIECLEESIKKCRSLSTAEEPIKFLEWMFENRVCLYLLSNMSKIETVMCYADNSKFISKSTKVQKNKFAYRWNPELEKSFQIEKELFLTIIQNASQYVSEKSIFDYYFNQCYNTLNNFMTIQSLYESYDQPENNEFKVSIVTLENWLTSEFHYFITKEITEQEIKSVRKEMKITLEKCIENCFKIMADHSLNPSFTKVIKGNISNLTNLLQLTLPKLLENNLPEEYLRIIETMLTYIKSQKYFHISFYSNNEKCLTFVSENYENNFQNILNDLVNKIVPRREKENTERIEQVRLLMSSCVDFEKGHLMETLKEEAPFVLGNQEKNIGKQTQLNNEAKFILDEIEDEVPLEEVNESIGTEKEELIDTNQPCFILAPNSNNISDNIHESIKFNEYYAIPSFYQPFSCFKCTEIPSIAFIKSIFQEPAKVKKLSLENNIGGIVFAPDTTKENNEKEFMKVKKFIKMQKLIYLLEEEMPEEEDRKKIVDHLEEGLGMISGFRVVEKNPDNLGLWKLFNCLSNLKQSLNLCNNDQKNANFAELLEIFSYQCDCIFSDAPKKNKIYLLTLPPSPSRLEESYFAYLSLHNDKPFENQPDLLPDENFTKIEREYFEYLLKDKEEQEWGELKIKEGIEGLNKIVFNGYREMEEQIGVWRKYGVDNAQECEMKMKEYLREVVRSRKFENGEVGYMGYCKMIEEYCEIILASNEYSKFNIIRIDDDERLPIFISRNHYEVEKFVFENFPILTDNFNGYSRAKEIYFTATANKNSNNYVSINMEKLIETILQNISQFESIEIKEVCRYMYGTAESTPLMEVMNKKKEIESFYPSSILKQFEVLSKIEKTIGKASLLQEKIRKISLQFKILEKFFELHAQEYCFILSDVSLEKEKEAVLLSKTSFLLSDTRILTEFKSYELEELYKLYKEAEISCQLIRVKGEIIGIVDQGMNIWEAFARLGIEEYGKLEWKKLPNNQKIPLVFGDIEIKNLFIEVGIGEVVKKFSNEERSFVLRVLENFYLQIKTYDSCETISELADQSYKKIQCSYPHRSIPIKLFEKTSLGEKEHFSFIIKHYSYGSQYILRAVEEYLIQYFEKKLQNKLEFDEKNKMKFMSESLGGKVSGVDVEKLIGSRVNKKFEKLERPSETDDESLEISIVLSEKGEVLRDQLIEMKLGEEKFKMVDVLQEIEDRRKKGKTEKVSYQYLA